MDDGAAELILTREALGVRDAVVAGGHHHGARAVAPPRRLHHQRVALRAHAAHRLPRARDEAEARRVGLEVGDHVRACRVARQRRIEAEPGEVRLLLDRVEAQPIVVVPPGVAERRPRLEDQRLDAAPLEAGRAREPCRPCPHDDGGERDGGRRVGGHGPSRINAHRRVKETKSVNSAPVDVAGGGGSSANTR